MALPAGPELDNQGIHPHLRATDTAVLAEHPFDLRFQSIERAALRRSAPKSGNAV
jgi:hypothetical protein